jgi:phosphohistidine phosphatase
MRRLMLLRHAEARRPEGVGDHDRPLTPLGRKQSAEMGKYLARQHLTPELAVISTARRTQETWALVLAAAQYEVKQQDEPQLYEAAVHNIIELLRKTPSAVKTLLLVGHNPGFEQLADSLVSSGRPAALSRLQRGYPTAGLAVIDLSIDNWADAKARSGHLERFESLATISH